MAQNNHLLPWVYDEEKGQLLVQADDGHDVNSKMLPAMQAYLQFYVAAASFKLIGYHTWTARAPFALLGALTLFVLWRTGLRLFGPGVYALIPPGLASVLDAVPARGEAVPLLHPGGSVRVAGGL